jgi:ABC-type branched-subunit amino acid transport system substrate-binding protein
MKKDGITKFAIVCGNDASGQGGAKALQSSAKAHGLTVTKTVFVPDDAPDATPQVQQAVSSGPQAIAVAAYTPADGPILKARTKLNVTLPVYGDAFFADVNFSAVVTPADLKGVVLENFPWLVKGDPATTTAGWRAFHAAFGKLEPHPPVTLAAPIVSYDAVLLARAAALRAKSVDGAALAKAMPHVSLASQVPGWIGGKKIYLPASHVLLVEASDLKFYKAGGQVDGLLVPGK